jgi:glutathione S-transferase
MDKVVLFVRPNSGSAVCEALLALTGRSYELRVMDKLADGSNPPQLLSVNPLGQVPALQISDGTVITESAAIALWIADLCPEKKLAPAISDPLRAKYLCLMLFMATNCYMSALRYYFPYRYSTDISHADCIRDKGLEHMHREWVILTDMLGDNDYLLGTNMSAADIYLSMFISWEEDVEDFTKRYPALSGLNHRVLQNKTVYSIWKSNGFAV